MFIGRPVYCPGPFFVIVFLQFFCVYGIAFCVSMCVRRQVSALMAVLVTLFLAVNCGYGITLVDASKYNIRWLFSVSPNRWAAEAHCKHIVLIRLQHSLNFDVDGLATEPYKGIYDLEQGIPGLVMCHAFWIQI